MWKKAFVICLALVGTFSVAYAMNHELEAKDVTYHVAAQSTMKLGEKGIDPSGVQGTMVKGDKVYVGINNPHNSEPLSFLLIHQDVNYTTYDFEIDGNGAYKAKNTTPLNGWFSMGNETIVNTPFYSDVPVDLLDQCGETYCGGVNFLTKYDGVSLIAKELHKVNQNKSPITIPRNLDYIYKLYNVRNLNRTMGMNYTEMINYHMMYPDGLFLADEYTIESSSYTGTIVSPDGGYDLSAADISYTESYYLTQMIGKLENGVMGIPESSYYTPNGVYSYTDRANYKNLDYALRLSAELDVSNVVFATGTGSNAAVSKYKNSSPLVTGSYTNIYDVVKDFDKLKLRVLDSSGEHAITFISIKNKGGVASNEVMKNGSVKFEVNAKSGIDGTAKNTISALFYKKNDIGNYELAYYKPLATANGLDDYEVTLADIDTGEYKIGLVNESYDETDKTPAKCSEISEYINLKIVDPLSVTHKEIYESGTIISNSYMYDTNTYENQRVGELGFKNGVSPITFTLSSDELYSDNNSYKNFKVDGLDSKNQVISTSNLATLDVIVDGTGPDIDPTTKSLLPNVYHYCITGLDKNNDPVDIKNKPTQKHCVEMDVYPDTSYLTYTQLKNADKYYTAKEINENNFKLGTIEFSEDAKIKVLKDAGYSIKTVQLVKTGTTTQITELQTEEDAKDSTGSSYNIKKKGAVTASDIEFDILITFQDSKGNVTAQIRKEDLKYIIPGSLQFVDPGKEVFLTESSYDFTYDPIITVNNTSTIWATDKDTPSTINADVLYCVLNREGSACDTSDEKDSVISITPSNGKAIVTRKGPGTTQKNVKIRAYIEDDEGNSLCTKDITIKVNPAAQSLSWAGKNIQTSKNEITKDSTLHNTWKLSLRYDRDNADNNVFSLISQSTKTLTDKTITLIDTLAPTLTPNIEYVVIPNNPKDAGKVTIVNDKLIISDELEGNVTIKAKAFAVGDYHTSVDTDDPKTPDVNEDECAYLVLNVITKPKVDFDFVIGYPSTGIQLNSNYAKGTTKLGNAKIDPSSTTGYTYSIDKVQSVNKDGTKLDLPKDNFLLKGTNGNELTVNSEKLGVSSTLPVGTYEVTIGASDINGNTAAVKVVTIKVIEASIDATSLKWQAQDNKEDATFKDIAGIMNKITETTVYYEHSTSYSRNYVASDSFFVKLNDPSGNIIPAGATITYQVEESNGIIKISEENRSTGLVNVLGTNQDNDSVKIKATIKMDGYSDCIVYLPVKILKGSSEFKFIHKDGTDYELISATDTAKYKSITLDYTKEKESKGIDVFTANAPSGSKVTISIEASDDISNGLNDVLGFKDNDSSINEDTAVKVCEITLDSERLSKCEPQIQNALNLLTDKDGKTSDYGKIIVKATYEETDDYVAKTIQIPVNIKPVKPSFAFSKDEIRISSDSNGKFTPAFNSLESNGKIQLLMPEADITSDQLWLYDEFDGDGNLNYYKGIDSYGYNIIVNEGDSDVLFTIRAQQQASRNYTKSDEACVPVRVTAKEQYQFTTTVKSYESEGDSAKRIITYGDTYFHLIPDNPDDDGLEVDYTFTINDEYKEFATPKSTASSNDKFIPLKAGVNIPIHVVRTVADQLPQEGITYITIKPREVKLKVSDISKKVGLQVTSSDYKVTSESEWNRILLADRAILGNLKFSCLNNSGKDVTTMSSGLTILENKKPINASFKKDPRIDDVLKNYKFLHLDGRTVGIESGTLNVTQDSSDTTWYEIHEGVKENGTSTEYQNGWFNGPVDVTLVPSETDEYDLIGLDITKPFNPIKSTVSSEGKNEVSIFFKKSSGDEAGAISSAQSDVIRIDFTPPKLKTITAKDANNKIQDILHKLSLGALFKPGTVFEITTIDTKNMLEVSGTDHLLVTIYRIEEDGSETKLTEDPEIINVLSENASIKVNDRSGSYKICTTAVDKAGNTSIQDCRNVTLGYADINETTGDGDCPDLNLDFDDDGKPELNIDTDGDNIPDLNIDSDYDGKPDINVDSDEDGKPDLNLVILEDWHPGACLVIKDFKYATQEDIIPEINIVIDNGLEDIKNQIPSLDIDNNGDFKADLNISDTSRIRSIRTPKVNIVKLHEWKPVKDYSYAGFNYDSIGMDGIKIELNQDSDEDGYPDINLDTNGDGTPDLNIDTDYDGIPDLNIDANGDGKPDFNIDASGNGFAEENIYKITEWKPNKDKCNIDGFEYDTMEIISKSEIEDNGIIVEKPDGSFLPNTLIKVNEISDSIDEKTKEQLDKVAKDQEVKKVYDVEYLENDTAKQPDGKVNVNIPIDPLIKNAKVVIEKEDGSFEEISYIEKDGYYVFETEYIGKVSVLGDVEEGKEPEPEPTPDPEPDPKPKDPSTSVQGTYTNSTQGGTISGMGGAYTGDETTIIYYAGFSMLSFCVLLMIRKRIKN